MDAYDRAGSIRRDLRTIHDHYDAALEAPRAADESGIRGASSREPLPVTVLDARRAALAFLAKWVGHILQEVNDGTIEHGPTTQDVDGWCEFVDRWTLALCEQDPDEAADLAKYASKHARRLRDLALGWQTKRIEVGRCPEVYPHPDYGDRLQRCPGGLWAILRSQDSMLPEHVTCDACDAQWLPHQWAALGKQLGRELNLSTAQEAMAEGVSQRTVQRRRASA